MVERPLSDDSSIRLRPATEADHSALARLIDEWWGERRPRVARIWFRHFAGLSWVAERADGRPVGVAIGARSHDRPATGLLVLVAVAPWQRRQGVGRSLVEAVSRGLEAAGVSSMEATLWPGNRVGVRFLEALGFRPAAEAVDQLYGVPAIADFDGEGEDRAIYERGP